MRFHTQVPHTGSTHRFHTQVPHTGSTHRFHTRVPHAGSARWFDTMVQFLTEVLGGGATLSFQNRLGET
jgi:hypothetical protein